MQNPEPAPPVVVDLSTLTLDQLTQLLRIMTEAAERGEPCPVIIQPAKE